MGEEAKLFIGQGVKIMVGDKPVGFAKGGMMTCQVEDDVSTKDSGAWENPMRHTYEITGKAVVTNVGDPIRELLNDMPSKVDVEIRREMGKMPRKMKKAYRTGSRYRRDTKWKRKAKRIAQRAVQGVAIRFAGSGSVSFEPGGIVSDKPVSNRGEYVVTKDERQRLEAMLKREPDREVVHVSINLDDLTMAEKRKILRR